MDRMVDGKQVLGVVALAVALAGCSDIEAIDGVFFETVDAEDALLGGGQPVAVRLDLFQFGNEAGGIVRYHSLEEVRGSFESPFDNPERVCFWTDRVRLGDNQVRFTLTFKDHRNQTVRLTLDRSNDGLVLEGSRGVRQGPQAQVGTLPNPPILLEKQEDLAANSNCRRLPIYVDTEEEEPFGAELILSQGVIESALAEAEGLSSGQLRVGLMWVGSNDVEIEEWAAPVQSFGIEEGDTSISHQIFRGLPPAHLTFEPAALPFVSNDAQSFGMLLGIPIVYRDRVVEEMDENGDVPMDWDKSVEPLVASTFRSTDGGRTFSGRVLLYVEGDPSRPPANYALGLFQNFSPRAGYEVVEVTFDLPRRIISSISATSADLTLHSVEDGAYQDRILPRLPRPCDRCAD